MRVNEDTKEGQLVTEFTELENRLPEQGEKFCFAAVDESGKGSAYISFPDGSGGFVAGIDGAYTAVVFGNADGETVYVEYTFTADFFAQGFEALAQDGYASFVFRYYPAMGNYFFVFDSSEQENYVIDDGESRIEFSVNGDGTAWLNSLLCAVTRDGDEFVLTTASGARGVVRVVGDGTAQLASSERGTYFALADGTPTLEKEMLFLDGFGGATMQRYVAATETSESRIEDVASGTYVRLDSASGYYEYDVSFADGGYENFRFAYGTITVGNSAVAVYILYDESQEESFETSDGGTLLIDAYGQATFEDASGEKRAAIASRAADTVIEGRELMRVRVLDADGKNYGAEKPTPFRRRTERNVCFPLTAVSASTSCSKGTKSFPSQSWFLTVWEGASCIAAKRNRKSKERIRRQRGKTSGFSAPTARRQRASASLSCAACRRRRERALTFLPFMPNNGSARCFPQIGKSLLLAATAPARLSTDWAEFFRLLRNRRRKHRPHLRSGFRRNVADGGFSFRHI